MQLKRLVAPPPDKTAGTMQKPAKKLTFSWARS
jgi:hypothetical protein